MLKILNKYDIYPLKMQITTYAKEKVQWALLPPKQNVRIRYNMNQICIEDKNEQ